MSDSDSSGLSSAQSNFTETLQTSATIVNSQASAGASGSSKSKKRTLAQVNAPNKRTKRARNIAALNYTEVEEDDTVQRATKSTPKKVGAVSKTAGRRPHKKVEIEQEVEATTEADHPGPTATSKKGGKKVAKVKTEETGETKKTAGENGEAVAKAKVKKKRKTKEEKEAEAMPIAARTVGSKLLVGAHVSSAGGVHNAIVNSVYIGGNALALFLKSQRKWENPPLLDEHCTQFLSHCKDHQYHDEAGAIPPIVPHGSYLVNLAHPDPDRTKQAYDAFLDDLDRCRKLGIRLYNFHPGNVAAAESRSHAIKHLAGQLNRAHKDETSGNVITLLETMAAGKNVLGSTFEDIAETIEHISDKNRVGVCLDTCHVFAAGYDLRSPEAFKNTIDRFDSVIGLKYLKAFHVNDSKAPLNSGRDLHANIGTGFLGLRAFYNLVNEPRLWGLPMVLETPIDVKDPDSGKEIQDKSIWAKEIKLLESLVGMDSEGEEFKSLEAELWQKGTVERERIQVQVDKREDKAKKTAKQKVKHEDGRRRKAKKAASSSDGGSGNESS